MLLAMLLVLLHTLTYVYTVHTLQDKRLQPQQQLLQYVHHIFHLLPTLTCWSPTDSLDIMAGRMHGLTF